MVQDEHTYRFDEFVLDVPDRQLWHRGRRLDLNARYFDALVLLVRASGQLVEKERFFEEVWNDVVVSDAALAQCIRQIRRLLGEDASSVQYIQTVTGYGYRFLAEVEVLSGQSSPAEPRPVDHDAAVSPPSANYRLDGERPSGTQRFLLEGLAGTAGGAAAGVFGGLLYGFALAGTPAAGGVGTASVLFVLLSLNVLVGAVGGLGVGFGMAAAGLIDPRRTEWRILGAALGGMLVGGVARLLGVDAFNLLLGRAPDGITGGVEGFVLGTAVAVGMHLGGTISRANNWSVVSGAGVLGGVAGVLIPLTGGHLMGGSLDLLARSFAESRLHLDDLGQFFGELHFGPTTQAVLGGIEGLLFGSCLAGAVVLVRRMMVREG
jgi:DNA-binding winged helix-turn-helix (wHTH) protein